MARIILGLTGSVATIKAPELFDALRRAGHEVRVVATRPSLYFLDPSPIEAAGPGILLRDEDEWPGTGYRRGDPVLHIDLRNWAEFLVVAPLDANTLAKFAVGISDNILTCLFRAWDFERPVFLAPAMNTMMWDSPVTVRHLRQLLEDHAEEPVPGDWTLDEAPSVFAQHAARLVLIPPQSKRLACGDIGIGAMANVGDIAAIVRDWADQAALSV